jgi:hypothetical protein
MALNLTTRSDFTPLEAYSITNLFIMHKCHEGPEENIKDGLGLRTKPAIPNPQDVPSSTLGLQYSTDVSLLGCNAWEDLFQTKQARRSLLHEQQLLFHATVPLTKKETYDSSYMGHWENLCIIST